ncbi:hypothetical protein EJB05_20794, partial [Eragrostis curvula]
MASANNWLGFSLSGQENAQPNHQDASPAAGIDISGGSDFYGLPTQPASDGHLGGVDHASYGIMEAFNRGPQETQGEEDGCNPFYRLMIFVPYGAHYSMDFSHGVLIFDVVADWNIRGMDYNGGASELSMLVGSSGGGGGSGKRAVEDQSEPKLEDFLGGNSFVSEQDQSGGYLFSGVPMASSTNSNSGSNTMELSMIKTWLRNNGQVPNPQQPPATHQPPQAEEMSTDASANSFGCSDSLGRNGTVATAGSSQSLALSMSTGSHMPMVVAGGGGGSASGAAASESTSSENKRASGAMDSPSGGAVEAVPRKSIDTFGQRTSIYRGVTRHRWTGRYEAHLWDNSCRREGQSRKGRQGGYDKEDKAARAYDLAALKYWGTTTTTNFPIGNYEKELDEMKHMTRQEYIAYLRRNSSGFSRGASKYRGVTRHHQHGRWQARIGRVAGNKDLYLGTFSKLLFFLCFFRTPYQYIYGTHMTVS